MGRVMSASVSAAKIAEGFRSKSGMAGEFPFGFVFDTPSFQYGGNPVSLSPFRTLGVILRTGFGPKPTRNTYLRVAFASPPVECVHRTVNLLFPKVAERIRPANLPLRLNDLALSWILTMLPLTAARRRLTPMMANLAKLALGPTAR